MIKLHLDEVKRAAVSRPPGYLQDILSNGYLDGSVISMDEDVFVRLRRKYSGNASNIDKIGNALGAIRRIAAAGLHGEKITVSNETQKSRMNICSQCEFFTGITCRKCGCHIRFKAKLQTEHCPVGKW